MGFLCAPKRHIAHPFSIPPSPLACQVKIQKDQLMGMMEEAKRNGSKATKMITNFLKRFSPSPRLAYFFLIPCSSLSLPIVHAPQSRRLEQEEKQEVRYEEEPVCTDF